MTGSTGRRRDTPPPRTGSGEADVLRGFLGYLRASIAAKVEDAPEPGVRTAAVLDGCADLGAPLPRTRGNGPAPRARWALTHLIEETGRHAGHADIIRELLDGATGR
ncbi:DUF664 domain-containing protein [Streptomyces sp. NPDC059248]|uniref:mycothiol transferase n=1 Tax=Streptomyces sp. NPDC059248 TaxID=3346791 RepID=UPI0036C1BA38